ncbi:MAG: hypothetical protein RIQ93_258 [Verrucomicrobiota bacterium]|jgi:glucose/arabinose dehydrogenase
MRSFLRPLFCALLFVAAARAADPLPYATEPAFGELKFSQPVGIVSPPGDQDRLFILEKTGRIMVFNVTQPAAPARVFLDLTATVADTGSEQGVLALAFHPDWRRNRQFYVWYTSAKEDTKSPNGREDRLSRFTISKTNPDAADPASEQPMIVQPDKAANHNGGELLFGPDGYLYLSLGDEGAGNDKFENSQRIDKDFFSGILRLDVDRKRGSVAPNPHPAVRAGTYAVPADNPYVGVKSFNGLPVDPTRVRTEFWAVGLRNPWRMSFDPATGKLWCGDVGQNLHEEVDLIVRGGNYGWNFREATFPFVPKGSKERTPPAGAKFNDPVWQYPRTEGLSITGGLVYRGTRQRDLVGKYIFGDYVTGRVWALDPDGDKPVGPERVRHIATEAAIVSFGRDPRNGDVLIASLTRGLILRLVPAKP